MQMVTAPAPKRWTLLSGFLLLLGFFGVQLFVGLVIAVVLGVRMAMRGQGLDMDLESEDWFMPTALLTTQLGTLVLLWANRRRLGARALWDSVDLRDRRGWIEAGAAFLLVPVVNVVRVMVQSDAPLPTVNKSLMSLATDPSSLPWVLLAMLGSAMVFVAPVAEEWLFRGIFQPILADRWGPWVAIPVTAGLFAVVHDFSTWWLIFVYGLAWGWLAYRRNSLTLNILVHGAWNLTSFFLILGAAFSQGSA